MKKFLIKSASFVMLAWVMFAGSLAFSLAVNPGQAYASKASELVAECKHGFLGLKPWYQYIGNELDDGSKDPKQKCNVKCFNVFTLGKGETNECGQSSSDVPLVLLAIADSLLRIAGLIALGFIFVGAFKYVGSQGNPDGTKSAQETIINALLGLAIALTAVAIVSFIGNKIGN